MYPVNREALKLFSGWQLIVLYGYLSYNIPMLNKIEGSYSPADKADVAYLLMEADKQGTLGAWAAILFERIRPRFGVYFSEIEKLCREYELTANFLAVPTYLSLERNPNYLVIDPNGKGVFRPFLALCCEKGFNQLFDYAQYWGIPYKKETNEINLEKAGMYKPSSILIPSWQVVYRLN